MKSRVYVDSEFYDIIRIFIETCILYNKIRIILSRLTEVRLRTEWNYSNRNCVSCMYKNKFVYISPTASQLSLEKAVRLYKHVTIPVKIPLKILRQRYLKDVWFSKRQAIRILSKQPLTTVSCTTQYYIMISKPLQQGR